MSGLIIVPGWDREDRDRQAEAELHYALDPAEAQMIADFQRCQREGHVWHTCPACTDRSCLRCGTASDA